MVSYLGKGALMAKFYADAAYRNIPIHPNDRFLLDEVARLLLR